MTELYNCTKCGSLYEAKIVEPFNGKQRKCEVCNKDMGNTVWIAQLIERNENHIVEPKTDIRFYDEREDMDKKF